MKTQFKSTPSQNDVDVLKGIKVVKAKKAKESVSPGGDLFKPAASDSPALNAAFEIKCPILT